jgi:hypothetical protein
MSACGYPGLAITGDALDRSGLPEAAHQAFEFETD